MVDPISTVASGVAGVGPFASTQGTTATGGTAPTGRAGDFGQLVTDGLQQVSSMEHAADAAIQDLATGGPTRIEDVMIATSQASLGIDMLARVRDRALEAYQEIMRMPL